MKKTATGSLPLLALAIALVPQSVQAQQAEPEAQTNPGSEDVDDDFHNRADGGVDIIVSAGRSIQDLDVLAGTSVVEGLELQSNMDGQVGEILESLPGVSGTGFSPGASRPILRGFGGERIRVLTDGVGTLDASNTSDDHAVSIDPLTVERIEVLRGPAVLLYGSQAIGGAVNVIDKRIPRSIPDEPIHVDGLASYDSVNDEYRVGASVDAPLGGGFVAHVDGSYLDAGDVKIPGYALTEDLRADLLADAAAEEGEGELEEAEELREQANARGVVPNTFVETYSVNGGLSLIRNGSRFGFGAGYYDTLYGVPENPTGGHHHEEEGEEDHEGEEHGEEGVSIGLQQFRADYSGDIELGSGFLGRLVTRVGYSDYTHTEYEGGEVGTVFDVSGFEGRAEFVQNPLGNLRGSFGAQFYIRDFEAVGEEAFVAPNETEQFGFFTLQELSFGNLQVEGAGRFETNSASSVTLGVDRQFDILSGALGLSYDLDGLRIGVNGSRVGRAPAGEELFANGPHVATGQYEVGDVDLDIERAWGLEGFVRGNLGPASVNLTVFGSWFDDYIYLDNTGSFVDEEGDAVPDGDEEAIPLFAYLQQDARYLGVEAEFSLPLVESDGFAVIGEASAEYVEAELDDGSPVPRIPPLGLMGALTVQTGAFDIRGEVEYFGEQNDVPAFESTTDAFTFVNASVAWRPVRGDSNVTLLAKVENIFDQEGRRATSFTRDYVPLPGRNLSVSARFSF
ncbi:TonB-dependent receptor [Alteriqipengyuania lutimaris]|uniref:TonB-dependent receptor n=1 Tax=Alteriqipengyuania lutimaris TaxID=1538146 RepID=A0A395LJ83_9SPHN|nr:TonB-dependent receptor [Alteriqipengyuania lutimaris]MBB3034018.1 iron complex outermembrane receptor protein [Alteriqipengyuania lutimaris]RDS77033.1 TonB-dependent receptor [Alteriqipengyuania lutimaris]